MATLKCQVSHGRQKWSDGGHGDTAVTEDSGTLVNAPLFILLFLTYFPTALSSPIMSRGRGLWESRLHNHTQPPEDKVKGRLDKLAYLNTNNLFFIPFGFMQTQTHPQQTQVR